MTIPLLKVNPKAVPYTPSGARCGMRPLPVERAVVRGWSLLVALCVGTLLPGLADPAQSLNQALICLSPTTVRVTGMPGSASNTVAERAYIQVKALLRAGGVPFREVQSCGKADADLTLSLTVRPISGNAAMETQISGRVDDRSNARPNTWVSNDVLRWSAVNFGEAPPRETELTAHLLEDTRVVLTGLVRDWKAANR